MMRLSLQDIMKKEDGAYAKYATAQLLALGYQSRLGVIAAGSHGAAQVCDIRSIVESRC